MKELKFRAFDTKNKVMIVQGNVPDENRSIFWQKWETTPHISEPMVFTGLKATDKKKHLEEEIYEGDIFRSLREDDNEIEREVYSVVMWIEQRAAFYLVPIEHYKVILDNDVSEEEDFNWLFNEANLYDFSIDCGLTKVGNVYQNPEFFEL